MEPARDDHPLLRPRWHLVKRVFRLFPGHAENYDHSNLKTNLRPENKKSDVEYAPMTFPYWNPDADMAHEVKVASSSTMSLKIMITKPSLFHYNILERKDLYYSGCSWASCPYYFFGMSLWTNTILTKIISESSVPHLLITLIKKIPMIQIPLMSLFHLGL